MEPRLLQKGIEKTTKKKGHQGGKKVGTRRCEAARPEGSRVHGRAPPSERAKPLGRGVGSAWPGMAVWKGLQDLT